MATETRSMRRSVTGEDEDSLREVYAVGEALRMRERTIVEGAGHCRASAAEAADHSGTLPDLHRISYTQNLPVRQ